MTNRRVHFNDSTREHSTREHSTASQSGYINRLFGSPNRGIHSIRIFGLAAIDVLFTLIGAFILAYGISMVAPPNFMSFTHILIYTTIGFFGLGILAHILFRVNTALNVKLFGML